MEARTDATTPFRSWQSRRPMLLLRRVLVLALLAGCVTARARPVDPTAVDAARAAAGDYSPDIREEAMWRALAASPGRQVSAHTEVVKVIIDLDDEWKVYFLQSRRWEIHYFFASRFLSSFAHPVEDHAAFNVREYRRPDRRFILGTLTHYQDQNVWAYDLIAGDTLDVARTVRAFEAVRSRVYFGDTLRYRPVPPAHEAALDEFAAAHVPVITTQALFGATRFQPLNPGDAWGWLRFIEGEPDPSRVRRNDVVVLDHVPLDLPVCAGIITGELQAPLSHVAVLATNRGTPDMALRDAFHDPRLRALEGRLVRLRVTPQEWSVDATTQAEAERAWERLRPRTPMNPPLSDRDVGLVDVATLRYGDVSTAGAKAAQLGELAAIGGSVVVPRAFAIPFHTYLTHLRSAGIDAMIRDARSRADFRDDPQVRDRVLADVRARIRAAPVDAAAVERVRARIAEMFPGRRVRLRSSTNAEDLPGFNGAGLYRSVVVSADPSASALADALRDVWASTWSLQAYEEREFFRIDHARVAMGVLAQESIDDDVVDGVAITANPFNQGRPAVFLNVQVAGAEGGAVTAARGDDVPEQVLYYTYGEEREFERLSRSSRTGGAPVLSDDEVVRVSDALRQIHARFNRDPNDGTPMDVEFLLAGRERRLVFVQARPYPIRWDHDRGYAMPGGE